MQRTKLIDRSLPNYTRGEELANFISHTVGGAFGVIALLLCPIIAAYHQNIRGITSGIIFGLSLIALYAISSVYHALSPKLYGKRVMQVLDHCTIFALIAGSYTPFALVTLYEHSPKLGVQIMLFIWGAAILGIVLNAIDLKRYRTFSIACYLIMGWCIVFKAPLLVTLLGSTGFALLLGGGILYTIGAVLYVIGLKKHYSHSVFHVFTVLGSLCHIICIAFFVM